MRMFSAVNWRRQRRAKMDSVTRARAHAHRLALAAFLRRTDGRTQADDDNEAPARLGSSRETRADAYYRENGRKRRSFFLLLIAFLRASFRTMRARCRREQTHKIDKPCRAPAAVGRQTASCNSNSNC